MGTTRLESVGAIGIASLRVQVLKSTAAFSHVYEAVVVVGHIAHQTCCSRDDATEVGFKTDVLSSVGCFERKLIVVSLVTEAA